MRFDCDIQAMRFAHIVIIGVIALIPTITRQRFQFAILVVNGFKMSVSRYFLVTLAMVTRIVHSLVREICLDNMQSSVKERNDLPIAVIISQCCDSLTKVQVVLRFLNVLLWRKFNWHWDSDE